MISFVEGKCVYAGKDRVVLEVGGLGYEILVTEAFASSCVIDKQYRLQTVLIVRENEFLLVGFAWALEREIFKLLTTISGVGPKLALKVLSALSPSEIASCVLENNVEAFKSVSGVGVKTAKRLILELQEKIAAIASELSPDQSGGASKAKRKEAESAPADKLQAEAKAVLISLGCSEDEADGALQAALGKLEPGRSFETSDSLVMAAMGEMGGN
ncbi:Holliday junction branch migration protein RuvA [bacterium]|nr:Holliday junction branch migration protein RuvA [bacterium]